MLDETYINPYDVFGLEMRLMYLHSYESPFRRISFKFYEDAMNPPQSQCQLRDKATNL